MTDETLVIEAMLLRWGENHASGRTVTFQLPEETGDHPFKGQKCGPANGQRLALSIAFIDDDETETPVKPVANKSGRPVSKPLAREAALYGRDPSFKLFLHHDGFDTQTDEYVAVAVREICGINSRSEIDGNPEAKRKWIDLRGRYKAWKMVAA